MLFIYLAVLSHVFPGNSGGKESACHAGALGDADSNLWVGKIP